MTDASGRKRQSKGTPTGGQFAAENRSEADIKLVEPSPKESVDQLRYALDDAIDEADAKEMGRLSAEMTARMDSRTPEPPTDGLYAGVSNEALVDTYVESMVYANDDDGDLDYQYRSHEDAMYALREIKKRAGE